MKKVIFILPSVHAGGTENYALRFIQYCNDKHKSDFEWHLVSLNLNKGDLHDNFIKANVNIYYQSIGYFDIVKLIKFYKKLNREKFDVICTFNGNFGGLSLFIANLVGVKNRIAWHRRSSDAFGDNPFKRLYNTFVNRLIRINATSILSNSKYALDTYYGSYYMNDARFKVISNGVNTSKLQSSLTKNEARKELKISENAFLIGHVGRYDPAKNHETIFKVANEVKKVEPKVRFLFCGKDTDSIEFIQRLQAQGIDDISFAIGLTDELPVVLKAIDLFYFPSLTEGQPNAMIEAMVAGRSVLPSNIPPILEALPKSAKAVDPTEVEDVVSQIIELIKDPELHMTYNYRQWATDNFSHKTNFELFKKEL